MCELANYITERCYPKTPNQIAGEIKDIARELESIHRYDDGYYLNKLRRVYHKAGTLENTDLTRAMLKDIPKRISRRTQLLRIIVVCEKRGISEPETLSILNDVSARIAQYINELRGFGTLTA